MLYKRRILLRNMLGLAAALGSLVMMPKFAFATWSKAFNAKTENDALIGLYNNNALIDSEKITLKLPEIAENGAVVPVSVKTDISNVNTISVFAEKNPQPLAASFSIPEGTLADVSLRIRLLETMNVKAVVEAGGKLYSVQKEVKVTIGGCGG